ncbi:helix-turn-helix transcriptional regulator [Streptomonospora sp. PA3]|uniref:helix-turn-helix transcriptional regulator n=1 Tax=Streptomonospora sp. PA3 TaxID=2607326 RepID=UPI0012DCFCAA|nr:helix-turn-helix transcriptional regulator [Streptomonospora sp. PA3]MUL39595.1 helix-turn-helix transcriptional regulator [Streptomonospora sp. PA3]
MPRTITARVNGAAIRTFRVLRNLNTRELAERVETTAQHISNVELETRPCSAVLAQRIADALAVDCDAILREPLTVTAAQRKRTTGTAA